jgi:hypothetical protein
MANGISSQDVARSSYDDELPRAWSTTKQASALSKTSNGVIRDKIVRLENAMDAMRLALDDLKAQLED